MMVEYVYMAGVHRFRWMWMEIGFGKGGVAFTIVDKDRPWVTRWGVEVSWWPVKVEMG